MGYRESNRAVHRPLGAPGWGCCLSPTDEMALTLQPISIRNASAYVDRWHRHLPPPRGALFALSAYNGGVEPVGVIIVGRPVARRQQDGLTCEIVRCAVQEGERNAASFLYGAAKRAAKALGYLRAVTSTLVTENGASMRAIGATLERTVGGAEWDRPSRERTTKSAAQLVGKHRWTLFDERGSIEPVPDSEGK